jgi:nicotinamidase-related amidase
MTRLLRREGATLVLVDHQERLMPAIAGGAEVVEQARRLAEAAALLGVRTVGTEQNPDRLGPNVAVLRQRCESTLSKMSFDACAQGLLELIGPGDGDVVLAGCEAHVCLLQTALGVLDSGRRTVVVADACGSRKSSDHKTAMRRLGREGVVVASTEMVVFEWLRTCEHAHFRQALSLIK